MSESKKGGFKPKKFKQKIGTKTSAGDEKVMKRFTNGHKTFTTLEARAMNEQQARERITSEVFDRTMMDLHRPRNPLAGEQTPRSGEMYGERKVEAFKLIPPDRGPPKPRRGPKEVTLKPGQFEGQFAKPADDDEDQLVRVQPYDDEMRKIDSISNLRDKVKAELIFMTNKLGKRQNDVNTSLIANYISSQGSNTIVRYKHNV
jgi:hypothetical protein